MAGGPRVFISYKRDHEPTLGLVTELEAELIRHDIQVLRDVDIPAGERWPDELWGWLLDCSAAVVVVTDAAAESEWCRREWSVLKARESHAGLRLIPVRIEPVGSKADILDDLQAVVVGPDDVDAAVVAVLARLADLPDEPPTRADYLAAHAAWLDWQFTSAPALGREPFSLADTYVDTECGVLPWGELRSDRTMDPFLEDNGGREDLLETVLGRFGDPSFRDLVVVQGPAGSGKSAFSLRLATRLATEGLTPVLVRFRDLRLSVYEDVDALLEDAVRVAPVGEHPPGPGEPLFADDALAETAKFRDADISRTVVILDGWDEVTLTGSVRFNEQVQQWLPQLRERFTRRKGPPVRLLITGRPAAVVERSRVLHRDTPILSVRLLRPEQLRSYAAGISARLDGADWSLDLDRFETAFDNYESWFRGESPFGPDVLGSPLLALLAFRTVASWPGDTADLFAQPTALYHALIEVTSAHAGKAEHLDDLEGSVHRGGRDLRRLLQRVAAIITAQGEESVSFLELARRLEEDETFTGWTDTAASDGLHELVVNFYFKGHPELGCEFLHKSFREYLFAEAVVAALEEASVGRSGVIEPPSREWGADFTPGSAHHALSRSLAALLGPQWVTPEVRTHVFWLTEQAITADPDRWVWIRDILNDIWGWWGEGAHLRLHPDRRRPQPPPIVEMLEDELPLGDREWTYSLRSSSFDAHYGEALIQLTAFVHVRLRDRGRAGGTRMCQVGDPDDVRFRPFNTGDAQVLVARLSAARRRPAGFGLTGAYLRAVDLSGEDLGYTSFQHAVLTDARLNGARAVGAAFAGADLVGADLTGANLEGATLVKADLTGARLVDAWMIDASMRGARLADAAMNSAVLLKARLSGATLAGAALTRADLREADLSGANLSAAVLDGADLVGCRLADANLGRAVLRETDLTEADLSTARLAEADLSGANLQRADLHGANLREAKFDGADLAGAKLVGAFVGGADLRTARLTRMAAVDADFSGAELGGADLRDADLRNARFDGADLRGADLRDADLRGAELARADLRDADLTGAQLPEGFPTAS